MVMERPAARGRSRRGWGFGLFVLATTALGAGLFQAHVAKHRREALTLWEARLTASAEDRSLAIGAYIKDRLSDAAFLASFPTTREVLADHVSGKGGPPKGEGGQAHLEAIFAQFVAEQKGVGVYLFDPAGALVTQAPEGPALDETCMESARAFLGSKRLNHVEFHRSGGDRPHLAVQVAVLPEGAGRLNGPEEPSVCLGALVLLLDPGDWLYPFMDRQRLPTKTGEALICERQGDLLVFLTPLRLGKHPPLGFSVPFRNSTLAGSWAVLGKETFAELTDYRGERIFAATRKIPNTGWGLVSKVDRSEALRDFHREILGDGAIAALALLGFWGAVLGIFVWKSRGEARAEARAQLEHREALEAKQGEILQLNRLLSTLSDINQMIVREADQDRLLNEACRILVERAGYRMAWVGFKEESTGRVIPAAASGHEEGYLKGITVRYDDTPEGHGPTGTAIREGLHSVNDDVLTNPLMDPWKEKALARGYRSSAAFPIISGGGVLGALTVYAEAPGAFVEDEVRLLEELAGDLGYALDAMEARERRAEAERARRETEGRYRLLFENLVEGFAYCQMIWDEGGHPSDFVYLEVNAAFGTLTGLKEVTGRRVSEVIPGIRDSDPALFEIYGRVARTGTPERFEMYVAALDMWFLLSVYCPERDHFVAVFDVITERKRAEEALREHRELLNTVVESITDPMYIKDLDGRYLLFNTAAARVTGRTPEEVHGKDDTFLFSPEEARVVMEGDRRVMESGTIVTYEERVTGAGGEPFLFLSTKGPRLNAEGRIIGLWGIAKDVTALKRSERMHALAAEVLGILNDPRALPDATRKILDAIARETGFDAVGIRLREGDDFPYAVASGFTSEFISAESSLLARGPGGEFCLDGNGDLSLECTCGLVLSGKTDPESPLFSPGGSAWTNDARSFLETPAEQDPRFHPRNRCIHEGYQSVALIPIRVEERVIGLLQLNDRRKDRFTPETIRFFEGIAGSFGVALNRMRDEEALRQRLELQDQLAKIASSVPGAIFSFRLSPDGKTTMPFSTPAIEEFFGFTPDELETDFSQALSRLNPEDSGHVWDSIQESARSLSSWSDTFGVNHPRRGEIWLEGHSVPRREEDGAILWHGYVQDVTDHKRAEAALRESEKRYRILSENSADIIWLLDLATLRFAYVSPSIWRLRGYTPEEVMAQPLEEALAPQSRAPVLEAIADGLARFEAGDESFRVRTMEVDQPRKDGTVVPTEVVTTFLTDEKGNPVSLLGVTRDITERKRAEAALRESEAKYRSILETMQDAYFRADTAGILTMVSPSAARMYGYASVEKIIGLPATALYASPGQRDEILRQLRETGRAADIIGEGLRKDGSTFWVSLSAQALRDGEGIATGTEAVVRDVTDRVEAERTLRESEAKYRTTLDSMLEGCQIVGRDWRYLYVNRAAAEHGRRPPEDLLGRTMMEAYPGIESSELFTLLQRAMEGETVRHQENRFAYPDGSSAWFDLSIQPVPEGLFILSVDITERKRAEDALRASEERFSSIFHASPMATALSCLADGTLMDVNPAWETLTGYPREEVVGRTPSALGLWADPALRDGLLAALRERDRTQRIEFQLRTRVLGLRDIFLSAERFSLHGEEVVLTAAVDITERKRAEREVRESRNFLDSIIEQSPLSTWISDRQGTLLRVNGACCDLLHITPEEVVGRYNVLRDNLVEEQGYMSLVRSVFEEGRSVHFDLRYDTARLDTLRLDRSTDLHLEVTIFPVRDEAGQITNAVIQHFDITAIRKAQEALAESEKRFKSLFENAVLGLYRTTPEGEILMANPALCRMLGFGSVEEMRARNLDEEGFEPEYPRDRFKAEIEEKGFVAGLEAAWSRADGIQLMVRESARAIRDESGKTLYYEGTVEDITERKRIEEDLRQYREHLEDLVTARTADLTAANRELEAFSYSVSHDLRAPVRAMDGFARILEEEQGDRLDDEGRRLLRVIQENSRRMGALVDDLLRLSRVGRQEMETAEVDMAAVAQSALADSSLEPERRGEVEVGPLPKVRGDAGLLHQVWVNLLSNAVKFTRKEERPRIEVGGEIQGSEAVYWVRDNGVGFDMRYSDKLFGVFQRLHAQDDFSGTGVGLALVHRVIQRHGGRIWAESEVGRGATFTFAIPVREGGRDGRGGDFAKDGNDKDES